MNNNFPRVLTLLRKERGISQKQAANDLQISQALLSHYEKGIRECGLDFVVKISDYYNVSCDYLLGKSPDKSGATISIEDIPDSEAVSNDNTYKGSILPTLNKKLIVNSIHIIFDILRVLSNKALTTEVSSYFMICVYKMFRLIYSTNPKNPQGIFSIPIEMQRGLSGAAQLICEANAECLSTGKSVGDMQPLPSNRSIELSSEIISAQYPLFASSLYNLIQTSENRMFNKKTTK